MRLLRAVVLLAVVVLAAYVAYAVTSNRLQYTVTVTNTRIAYANGTPANNVVAGNLQAVTLSVRSNQPFTVHFKCPLQTTRA